MQLAIAKFDAVARSQPLHLAGHHLRLPVCGQEEDDDQCDGEPDQEDELLMLLGEDVELLNRILKGYKVEKLTEIPIKNFQLIMRNIKAKRGIQ